jgi:hypothetical protein
MAAVIPLGGFDGSEELRWLTRISSARPAASAGVIASLTDGGCPARGAPRWLASAPSPAARPVRQGCPGGALCVLDVLEVELIVRDPVGKRQLDQPLGMVALMYMGPS